MAQGLSGNDLQIVPILAQRKWDCPLAEVRSCFWMGPTSPFNKVGHVSNVPAFLGNPARWNRAPQVLQRPAKSLPVLAAALALLAGGCSKQPTWTYRGQFHEAVAQADRVVVRDGGYDFEGRTDNQAVLFELADPGEIKTLLENLEFKSDQERSACQCPGYPRLDWYQGKQPVAITSIQHGRAVRWKGFQGDGQLTEESGAWLVRWLLEHGVDQEKMKLP